MDARKIQAFGVGYGFITDASADGSITINAKALAKIEPGADDAIAEMQRRANAYPEMVQAIRTLLAIDSAPRPHAAKVADMESAIALLRRLGEAE